MNSCRRHADMVKEFSHDCTGLAMEEITIPTLFRCPISLDLMKDPVTLLTGITYDRESIEKWMEAGHSTCPLTNQPMESFHLIPNHTVRKMIQEWCVNNPSLGIERVPTPRVPVTANRVLETRKKMETAIRRRDARRCREAVAEMEEWANDSERNKRCIAESGAAISLSGALDSFGSISFDKFGGLLKEIMSVLTWMIRRPGVLSPEVQSKLSSAASLRSIVQFLISEDLSARQNAVLVLKDLLVLSLDDQRHVIRSIWRVEGIGEALVGIIRNPVCPTATKAALVAIFRMVSAPATAAPAAFKFLETSLVSLLIDLLVLVDADKSTSEKALGVLDLLCNYKQGREIVCSHALAMPILVNKMLRVSSLAGSAFAVSVMWKLCKEEGAGAVVAEALEEGAFESLLSLLQVGCGETTKEKVNELLKLMKYGTDRGRLRCLDFNYLKR